MLKRKLRMEVPCTLDGYENWYNHYGKIIEIPQELK